MEIINPFEVRGNWYKGNLHTHTQNSDGAFTPEETCMLYSKAGYSFLAITDHNRITKGVKASDDLLLIESCEIDVQGFHIVGIDMEDEFDKEGLTPQQVIDRMKQQDAIVILAHPYWSGLTSYELLQLEGYEGIEIYNHVCHRMRGKGYSSVHIDEVLQKGKRTFCFAVDDCHIESDIANGFIMVKSGKRAERDILTSIKKGNFYSSTGLFIKDIIIENTIIKVYCDPAETIDFIGYNATGERRSGEKPIEYAEYQIKGTERYIRIEITDRYGKKAWTNPVVYP
ncbi:MAG TPA: CehA/McbA family metallohydrolase [bacterium]|nr:CehA/McbA family metallohydrolase [bacterium]HPP30235.1 CehA/McbA family metallohydrolase [bacterium]